MGIGRIETLLWTAWHIHLPRNRRQSRFLLVLIVVACSLLDRRIAAQSEAFEQEGGFTERMYRVRKFRRRY
jgi:four helix bundle suffix protein